MKTSMFTLCCSQSWVMSKHFQTACHPITAVSLRQAYMRTIFLFFSLLNHVSLLCGNFALMLWRSHDCKFACSHLIVCLCPRGRFGLCSCSVPPQMGNKRDIQLFITLIHHHQFINPKTMGSVHWLFLPRPLLPLSAMNGKFTVPQMRTNMEAEVCQPPDNVSDKAPQDLNAKILTLALFLFHIRTVNFRFRSILGSSLNKFNNSNSLYMYIYIYA